MPHVNFTDLSNRVAVVTGATSGIGRELAVGLAQAGAHVVACGRRSSRIEDVCKLMREFGVNAIPVQCDVTNRASVDDLKEATLSSLGQVDILVNAAGITQKRRVNEVEEDEWNRIMDTNLTAILRTCQSFYRALAQTGHGRIINIASLGAFASLFQVAAYNSSKAGVIALTRSLAIEWAKEGVNVNAIVPGVFRTEMNEKLLDGTERKREYLMRTPMARLGDPKELVGAAVFLASDSASFITGSSIVVDGGFLASGVNS